MPHISIKAEKIGDIFGLPFTNSILTTWIVILLLIIGGLLLSRNLTLIPNKRQNILEMIIETLYNLFKGIIGEGVKQVFPLLATFFIFIITANWMGLLPGVGSIGIHETVTESTTINDSKDQTTKSEEKATFTPLFRGATADLNTTLALALISVIYVQYKGFQILGAKTQLTKYFNFTNPINFYVGILDLISEFSRIISFAFRLFGNIFAGEVLLTIVAFLAPFIAPVPFLALEVFVGFIQALVFSMLSAVFLNVAVQHAELE